MTAWAALASGLDAAVDGQWGERFRFVPWSLSDYGAGVADVTRPVVETVGVLVITRQDFGRIGERMAALDAADVVTISVAMAPLRVCRLRQGDLVEALDVTPHHAAGAKYEIDRITDDHSGRGSIYLRT